MRSISKNDLIRISDSFDDEKIYMQYVGNDVSLYDRLSSRDIYIMADTKKVLDALNVVFKDMVLYLLNNSISYNQLSICPSFSIFVDANFVNSENGTITNKQAILNDYVGINGMGFDLDWISIFNDESTR